MIQTNAIKEPTLARVYSLFAAVIFIWGFSWPINKIGIEYIHPIWFATFRLILGTLSMFALVAFLKRLVIPSRKDLPLILTLGFFQMGLFTLFINIGLFYVDAGRSAILTYTTPFWILPFAVLFFHEKLSPLKLLGFLMGLVGVLVLFSPWSIDWSDQNALLGNGLLLLAAISFGISLLCARNMTWHRPAIELLPWQLLVGIVPVSLLSVLMVPNPVLQFTQTGIFSLLYTGILGTGIAYWCSNIVSKELPSMTVSIGFLGVPICGLLSSAIILHEPITAPLKIAMFFIPCGVLCVTLGSKSR
ncbi:MAG: DMT family transporter [Candidatus Berkiella sp.]